MPAKTMAAEPLPNPLSRDDLLRVEEALRQLTVAKSLIERCKRCNIPVSEAEGDCDALIAFHQSVLAEFKGPQAPIP